MDRSTRDVMQALQQRLTVLKARGCMLAGLAAAAAPLFLLTTLVPRPLVLPIYCLCAVAIAATVTLYAHIFRAPMESDRLTAWDVAGGFAVIGVAAAIFSEPAHLIALFDGSAAAK